MGEDGWDEDTDSDGLCDVDSEIDGEWEAVEETECEYDADDEAMKVGEVGG